MIPLFQVDAFTAQPFGGNPAAVCLLEEEGKAPWMQQVAAEMHLPETAFVTPGERQRGLRWFTPTTEVDLCGHATLAAAHVLLTEGLVPQDEPVRFATRSGPLTARSTGPEIELDLPSQPGDEAPLDPGVLEALGVRALRTASGPFELVEVASEAEVAAARPDLIALGALRRGHLLTARAGDEVVCRVFAPGLGIDEDPVTGSAQCMLAPWWVPRLGRASFVTRQLSRRGGSLRATLRGDRVGVAGRAVTTLRGWLLA